MGAETSIPTECAELVAPTPADRAEILAHWRAENDHARHRDAVLVEAPRMSRVLVTANGPEFELTTFSDVIEFIEELLF
jgi:hypothetical protein